jgi:hypothetical protein
LRVLLGGVRAEVAIRDRRRTHIGSMPGTVIQSIRKAKSSNPLAWTGANKMSADFGDEHHVGEIVAGLETMVAEAGVLIRGRAPQASANTGRASRANMDAPISAHPMSWTFYTVFPSRQSPKSFAIASVAA